MIEDYEKLKRKNLLRVSYIGFCFMLLFTAFQSAQNLVSEIYEELGYNELGKTCIFVIYGAFGIGNIFASHFKKKLPHKVGLMSGAFIYSVFIGCGALATYCYKNQPGTFTCTRPFIYTVNIVSAGCLGFLGSFLWLSQSDYVNTCADENTKGLFNGIFWSLMQTSQIIGSILATFVLGNTNQFIFYMMLLCFSCLAFIMFAFLPPVIRRESFVKNDQEQLPIKKSLEAFFAALKSRDCRFLVACSFLSGNIVGAYTTFLPNVISLTVDSNDDNYINTRTGYVLMALAAGEVIAGFLIGKLADIFNKTKLTNLTIMIAETALFVTLLAYIFKSYVIVVVGWFFWGFSDNSIQTLLTAIVGSYFNGRLELFTLFRFMQGIGVVFGSLLSILIPSSKIYIYFIIVASCFVIIHIIFALTKINGKPHRENQEPLSQESLIVNRNTN